MIDYLAELVHMAEEIGVLDISREVLDDERFPVWSGSSKPHQHHYGKGGLVKHTYEVVTLCLANRQYFASIGKEVNEQQVFLAALFHDAGKMWDYEPTTLDYTEWAGGSHKKLIHHIARSAIVWNDAAKKTHFDADEVLHAILSHHMLREWGSPVVPQTRLAWLLSLCDGLSARMDDLGMLSIK